MKNLFIIALLSISFFACNKEKNLSPGTRLTKITGVWQMTEARYSHMNEWHDIPTTEAPVTITSTHISNPWDTTYVRVNENAIIVNSETINVFITSNTMLWVSNLDSLRFVRL